MLHDVPRPPGYGNYCYFIDMRPKAIFGKTNLAVWFCARHGPTPFLAFGTPAPFRGARAASRARCTTGAAGKKKTIATSLRLARVSRVCTHVEKLWPSAVFMSRCALPSALPFPHQQ